MTAYAAALQATVAAVAAASAALRAEARRPGGPRGQADKMPLDAELEARLAPALQAAFPAPVVGEELGPRVAPAGADGRHVWYVDPHDGTRPFLEGWRRGSSIAVGLVRDGVPVLGVVSAPLWPDDAGTLLAWAEGTGPVTRNGIAVTAAPLGGRAAGPDCVVAVHHRALTKVEANARLTRMEPDGVGRFLPVPSLALRIALCAAGEADAAVSLWAPSLWDVAGAFALIRGAGGLATDKAGTEIDLRRPLPHGLFVGAPSVVAALRGRDWSATQGPGAAPARPTVRGLARIADPGLLSRAQACLLGLLAGDALGAQVEFQSAAAIEAAHPGGLRTMRDGIGPCQTLAGQPTDDGELALALARALVAGGRYDPAEALDAYAAWLRSEPFDCGTTIARALETGQPTHESEANGALMRVAPIGIRHAGDPQAAAAAARLDARLTHPNPVTVAANGAFAAMLAVLIAGARPAEALPIGGDAAGTDAGGETVRGWMAAASAGDLPPGQPQEGWVGIAFTHACHHLGRATPLSEALPAVVGLGGDTDTNAAITGALLGAAQGLSALPLDWRRAVLTCRAVPGTRRPRTPIYWADDALELAEALLPDRP